jgi:hypothetical protein
MKIMATNTFDKLHIHNLFKHSFSIILKYIFELLTHFIIIHY